MAALFSVWLRLACLALSLVMLLWRPAFHDVTVLINMWFACPGTICIAGLVLWAHRKDVSGDAGIAARRVQAKVAIGLALAAAAIVYALVIGADRIAAPA
ncbi:MAG: hypothetical protein GY778_06540 [bacterium]|nr:hypothetical protein [bacterium]